jgi:hypothetical protein
VTTVVAETGLGGGADDERQGGGVAAAAAATFLGRSLRKTTGGTGGPWDAPAKPRGERLRSTLARG